MNSKHNLVYYTYPSQGCCNQNVWEPSICIPMHLCFPHVPLHFHAKNQSHEFFQKDRDIFQFTINFISDAVVETTVPDHKPNSSKTCQTVPSRLEF